MLFSRSGGREFKPNRGHLFKGIDNLDDGLNLERFTNWGWILRLKKYF